MKDYIELVKILPIRLLSLKSVQLKVQKDPQFSTYINEESAVILINSQS